MSRTSTCRAARARVTRTVVPWARLRTRVVRRARARWRPLVRGDAARRIHRVVERVPAAPQARGASLSMGDAGIALALHTLATARDDERAARAARACMDRAITAIARDPMPPWLFDGYTGVAWVAHHLFGEGGAEVDAAVGRVVRDRKAPHELYAGLAGLGLYALARPRAGLSGIVTGLGCAAVRDAEGITWDTPLAMLPPGVLPPGAHHHYNLGIAHGLPGVIGMLALAFSAMADRPNPRRAAGGRGSRSSRAVSAELLDGGVRWLLARRLPDGAGAWFPGWFDPDIAPVPARQGWCYGDAALARVLWLAARAADEPAWRRIALQVARRAAARPLPAGGSFDAGLCHGSAGLAHLFNRHWQETGERVFADAARRWFDRAIAHLDRVSGDGLLSGKTGVALALLHAVTAQEPTWDRVLLLS